MIFGLHSIQHPFNLRTVGICPLRSCDWESQSAEYVSMTTQVDMITNVVHTILIKGVVSLFV